MYTQHTTLPQHLIICALNINKFIYFVLCYFRLYHAPQYAPRYYREDPVDNALEKQLSQHERVRNGHSGYAFGVGYRYAGYAAPYGYGYNGVYNLGYPNLAYRYNGHPGFAAALY